MGNVMITASFVNLVHGVNFTEILSELSNYTTKTGHSSGTNNAKMKTEKNKKVVLYLVWSVFNAHG